MVVVAVNDAWQDDPDLRIFPKCHMTSEQLIAVARALRTASAAGLGDNHFKRRGGPSSVKIAKANLT